MNKDKQIEEMAKDIEVISNGNYIDFYKTAKILVEKGYRKASEVAEDIVRMLRAAGINEWRYPIVADIKKKYTESEKD